MSQVAASLILGTILISSPASANLADVETAFIKKDYAKTRQLAEEFLSSETDESKINELKYYIGISQVRLGQYDEARAYFTLLLEENLNTDLADKVSLGVYETYYADGQYKEAYKKIRELLKKSPRSEYLSLIYLKMARVNLKMARWNKASAYLKKILKEFPNSLESHTAKQLLQEKQYFAVQVGAFLNRDRAQKMVTQLQKKWGYAYIVQTTDHNDQTFYRVRVGQLALLDDAKNLKSELSQEGYPARIYP